MMKLLQGQARWTWLRMISCTACGLAGIAAGLSLPGARAESVPAGRIIYNSASNCIWVTGFPEEAPATLADVRRADREQGWGQVAYDPATDTYRLQTSLWIGWDQDAGTYFQIGQTNHPRETLVIKGNLWIRSAKKSEARIAGRLLTAYIVNRLTAGDRRNPAVQPAIKFDCARPGEFGLLVGTSSESYGGDLYLYHATITAAVPDNDHRWRGFSYENAKTGPIGGWWCAHVRLVDSTVSWAGGALAVGSGLHGRVPADDDYIIDGVTFEDCENVRIWAVFPDRYRVFTIPPSIPLCFIKNCVFRRNKTVAFPYATTLVNCRFEANGQNLAFPTMPGARIALVDCELQPPKDRFEMPKVKPTPEQLKSGRIPPDVSLIELTVPICRIQDRKGRPIPLALVTVECPDDETAVHRGMAVTDPDGRTPAEIEKGALLITRRQWTPQDDPCNPQVTRPAYTIRVEAVGYRAQRLTVDPATELPCPLVIELTKS